LSGDDLLDIVVAENVLVQIEHLRTQPAVAAALSRGALRLHAWVYTIETGEVFAYDPEDGQYSRIEGQMVPVVQGKRSTIRPWS
jgi:carbonic anhydrase